MMVQTRRVGESLVLESKIPGEEIIVTVRQITDEEVVLSVELPRSSMTIYRGEAWEALERSERGTDA